MSILTSGHTGREQLTWYGTMGRATAAAMDAALADDEPDNDAQEAR